MQEAKYTQIILKIPTWKDDAKLHQVIYHSLGGKGFEHPGFRYARDWHGTNGPESPPDETVVIETGCIATVLQSVPEDWVISISPPIDDDAASLGTDGNLYHNRCMHNGFCLTYAPGKYTSLVCGNCGAEFAITETCRGYATAAVPIRRL